MSKLTPMMQQYQAIKAEHRDAILFFRLGDFYEMFGQDAIEASKLLDITLTARNKKSNPIPMCGVPYHSAENYIARLTKAGRKVAICEQVSDPSLPGIVKRKVVRVITPGTTFNDQILQGKANRYVLSIFPKKDYYGIAFADLTTGEFQAAELQGEEELKMEILRIDPVEVVVSREHYDDPDLRVFFTELLDLPLSTCELYEEGGRLLRNTLKVTTLEGYGIANWPFAIQAAAVLMRYLLDTQQGAVAHIDRIRAYHREHWMPLDESTIRNLELFSTIREEWPNAKAKGTLLSILDQTQTSMGGRLLRRWIAQPLLNGLEVQAHHEAVDNLLKEDDLRHELLAELTALRDLERLLARLAANTGNARDLLALGQTLGAIPRLKGLLEKSSSKRLLALREHLTPLDALVVVLKSALMEEAPLKLKEGGLIKSGYNDELDELRDLMKDVRSALKSIEEREIQATGISSMKIKFNKVFGYYLEVSKSNLSKVPERYIRKQTLVNAERYVTPELKDYEEKVLTAEERAKTLEYELFLNLRERALRHISAIKQNARALAELDVLLSFAQTAIQRNYVRPQLTQDRFLQIKEGRHPVVESMNFEQSFTPNDAHFASESLAKAAVEAGEALEATEIKLITGPNMSGKSTYLRQVALIALMNQIGSFVPAGSATLPLFDRIFTRVGASDNLVRGQSTFMVEMQEAAFILHHATDRSLIILDEIGRGTSTYDGLSIAWSILEYLHHHLRAFALFATHYHELIQLTHELPHAKNYSVDVQESANGVLFLHKIKKGGVHKSYGIEVAKLAGLPRPVIDRAMTILHDLESERDLHPAKDQDKQMDLFSTTYESSREPGKLTHPALERLQSLDMDNLTPLQALNMLDELRTLE